jgi:hypothetical protein
MPLKSGLNSPKAASGHFSLFSRLIRPLYLYSADLFGRFIFIQPTYSAALSLFGRLIQLSIHISAKSKSAAKSAKSARPMSALYQPPKFVSRSVMPST